MEEFLVQKSESEVPYTLVIRSLQQSDLPALEWEGEYRHFRNVFADIYKKVEKGTVKVWVSVTKEGEMVGQVFLQLSSDRLELADGWKRAYLYSLRVKPQWQNLGIGTRLIDVVEKDLLKMNFSRVTLNVARDNQRAIRLYARIGYQIVAEEPGIWSYPDEQNIWRTVTEPSWRMEKKLVD